MFEELRKSAFVRTVSRGLLAFDGMGKLEDPPFTIKQMVVSAAWPGATSREVEQQVTDKIETKLQELPYFFNVTSYTKPGETVIYVSLRDDVPPAKVADLWYQVRKKVGDILEINDLVVEDIALTKELETAIEQRKREIDNVSNDINGGKEEADNAAQNLRQQKIDLLNAQLERAKNAFQMQKCKSMG